jgi:glycosyltransferase involved in cell wall biosynthesis
MPSLRSLLDPSSPGERHSPPAEAALRGRDIICFSHDWTGDPLSKTHLMRLLARDNRILWVNSIGYRTPTVSRRDLSRAWSKLLAAMKPITSPEPNIWVLSPLAVPAYQSGVARRLNRSLLRAQVRRAMRRLGFRKAVNWVFNPPAAVVAGTLGEERLVYHCVDEYAAFSGVSRRTMEEFERSLLLRADLSIVTSEQLLETRGRINPRTVLVRHGVDVSHFRRALDPLLEVPADVANLPHPIIGFFGLIADWIDLDLVRAIAHAYPDGSVVLLGKVVTDTTAIQGIPNVHLLGRKPYAELPAYCKAFDVALNPFRINELTLSANPLKVREYLAAGVPVVSTPIPEVERLGGCYVADGPAGTIAAIEEALTSGVSRSQRSDRMNTESWESRLEEIRHHFAAMESARMAPLTAEETRS